MKLNRFWKYAAMALLPFSAFSCVQEEYVPGDPDLEDSFGVYFPSQSNAADIEIAPEDPRELTFTVKRLNDKGAITVPYTVSGSDVFNVSELKFENGQSETTLKVTFPDIRNTVKYSCTIDITDPQYSLTYGLESHTLSFSVTVVEWREIGTAKWRDDVISSFLSIQNPYAETSFPIFERADKPGYYKLEDVYTAKFFSLLFSGSEDNYSQFAGFCYDSPIYIDATNASKVYIVKSEPGLDLGSGMGVLTLASQVKENGFDPGEAYGQNNNGVIEFPTGGVQVSLADYNDGSWMTVNNSGRLRLLLPGARVYDYSVTLASGIASEGKLPVAFVLGADIATVKYAVCSGRISETEIASMSQDIDAGKVENVNSVSESSQISVTCPETGVYTLVTANYDGKGEYRGYSGISFTYLAAGDDTHTVVINSEVIISDKNIAQGYTSENSLEYYVYGKDITEAYIGLFRMSDLEGVTMDDVWKVMQMNPSQYRLSSSQVAEINNSTFGGIVGGLTPGTEYNLIVIASNGYERRAFNNRATTKGEKNILYETITDSQLNPTSVIEDYCKEWDFYAVNLLGKTGLREKIGKVTISKSPFIEGHDEVYQSFVTAKGALGPIAQQLGIKDELHFGYYLGFLFPLLTQYGKTDYYDVDVYPASVYLTDKGYALPGDGLLLGGLLIDGGIAFAEFGAASYGYGNFIGWGLSFFGDETITYQQLDLMTAYSDILLLDPAKSDELTSGNSSAAQKTESLRQLSVRYSVPSNYVETPFGRFKSLVDKMLEERAPKNYLEGKTGESVRKPSGSVPVEVSASMTPFVYDNGPVKFVMK